LKHSLSSKSFSRLLPNKRSRSRDKDRASLATLTSSPSPSSPESIVMPTAESTVSRSNASFSKYLEYLPPKQKEIYRLTIILFEFYLIFNFYRDNGVNYITLGDIDLLVAYFDSDRDGYLSYNE
jgi:hypothetical protein